MTITIKDSELEILDFMKSIEKSYDDYYAIYFHLSQLLDRNRNEFQIKIGLNIVGDFLKKHQGKIFLLKNYDVIVFLQRGTKELVEKIIYQLRYLYIDDPLAFKHKGEENPEFSNVYVLAFQWNEFLKICRNILETEHKNTYQAFNNNINQNSNNSIVDKLVTSYNFSRIENDLIDINITSLIRRQNISVYIKDKTIKPIFNEIYVSISQLRDYLKYENGFLDNKLLHRYFIERVDNRVLQLIKSDLKSYIKGATNLNLNIETILSEEFLDFHKKIKSTTNASMVIDIDLADVFLDLSSFYYANQFLKELGYRTCLDGIDNYSFIHIDRESLDFDLIKLNWDPDSEESVNLSVIKNAIGKCNPNRIILTNCNDEGSIRYGHNLGLFLFQGWWLERNYSQERIAF